MIRIIEFYNPWGELSKLAIGDEIAFDDDQGKMIIDNINRIEKVTTGENSEFYHYVLHTNSGSVKNHEIYG